MKRQIELSRATAYTGTCADMCPERERESRLGFQLSIFERDHEDQPDECLMVKEYRRAGADQEEPAPDDLRTPRALQVTMDHLICNIMDDSRSLSPDLALEWYDFLWDRLRAIRKDITQQNICDEASAILVERCTRFHVHSCYAMNHVKDFDVDMNKRNLNDCLQMLRQMYHDLRNEGIICEGELEFQKYNILLHLDEDSLSTTVLMKTSDHRSSLEMKFIIQIFNAYLNNDYYKFFQLMLRADYMTSCILSLYVNNLRLKALKIMLNSCATRQMALYPADLVIETLGFDGMDDLNNFTAAIGIQLQEKSSKYHLMLNKDLIRNIDRATLPSFKSQRLVENKMFKKTVGELVYGPNEYRSLSPEQEMDDESDPITYPPQVYTYPIQPIYDQQEGFHRLIVRKATKETEGVYTCLVENESGTSSCSTQLVVGPGNKPKLTSRLQDVTVYVGQSLEFRLKSTGLPPIDSCQWFKDDKLIIESSTTSSTTSTIVSKSNERISMSRSEEWSGSRSNEENKVIIFKLCIDNLKLEDTGRYKCRIINEFGYDETDCQVKLLQEIIEKHEKIEETIEETMRFGGSKMSSREEADETVVTEEQIEEESTRESERSIKSQRQEEQSTRDVEMAESSKVAPRFLRILEDTESTVGETITLEEPQQEKNDDDDDQNENEIENDEDDDHESFVRFVKSIKSSKNSAQPRNCAKLMPAGRFRRKTYTKPASRIRQQQQQQQIPPPPKPAIRKSNYYNRKLVDMQQAINYESTANEKLLELIKVFIQ